MFKFIGDKATQQQMEKAEKEKGGVCPFTIGTQVTTAAALEKALPCGAWCKLYNKENNDCRLAIKRYEVNNGRTTG